MSNILNLPTPISVSAGAIYPYSEELLAMGHRVTRYGDDYNMFRSMGTGAAQRVWVPRNLAPAGGVSLISDGITCSFNSYFVPRNTEQARVIEESVQLLENGESFVVECPTGFGKTACAMDIIAQVGLKTLIVVTKEDILVQWVNAAKMFLKLEDKDIGVIQGTKFQVEGRKFVIAMVQSLAKESRHSLTSMSEFGLVIWDEVHRVGADFFSQSCFRVPARLRLGLSATPDRKDGRELVIRAHIGRVLVKTDAAPMTPRIITRESPWKVPMTTIKDSKTGKTKVGPVPHSPGRCGHIINMLCKNAARNELLARFTYAAYKKGRTCLVQSDRKEHLETLALLLQSYGVASKEFGYYIGGMNEAQRDASKVKPIVLATYQMTAEATDIPWLDTLIMGTPKSDVRQIVGRVIRAWEGKQEPIVFDIKDLSSPVFSGYWNARKQWYASIGAQVDVAVNNT